MYAREANLLKFRQKWGQIAEQNNVQKIFVRVYLPKYATYSENKQSQQLCMAGCLGLVQQGGVTQVFLE